MTIETKKKAFLECFTDFMGDSEGLTQEDIAADLKEQKIDINQLRLDVVECVKRGSEERRLGWKKHAKQRIARIEKIIGLAKIIPNAEMDLKDKITGVIKDMYGLAALNHAEAYFRKRSTLSETDIMNLFEDLERLDALDKHDKNKDNE